MCVCNSMYNTITVPLRLLDPLSVYDVLDEATSGDPKVVAGVVTTCEAATTVFSQHKPRHRGSMVAAGDFANMLARGWDGDATVHEGGLGELGHVHNPRVRRRAQRRSIVMLKQGGGDGAGSGDGGRDGGRRYGDRLRQALLKPQAGELLAGHR